MASCAPRSDCSDFSSSICSRAHSSSLLVLSSCSWFSIASFSAVSFWITSALDSSFLLACVFTSLHRAANSSVLMVSARLYLAVLMQARRAVRLLPMRASFSSRVSLDSRNGGSPLPVDRSEITRDRVESDWLMPMPSLSLVPLACVFFWRSLPARSTKWTLAWLSVVTPETLTEVRIWTVKIAWDREDVSFICVAPTARRLAPKSKSSAASE
mmetsp:Transcript_101293/g.275307  ORF Transcript_101293/g.275307 Transcript_101293/m.275307 type:complete len:213 (+) Transcript_101293:1883-2521(+)